MNDMKYRIDMELADLVVTQKIKENIYSKGKRKRYGSLLKYAATFAIVLLLGGTTATAVKYFNDMHVNQELLPELDGMHLVEINEIEGATDGYDGVTMEFQGYEELETILGINLLDSKLRTEHPYMFGMIDTNNEDYAMIKIKNYIIGDTSNYRYAEGDETYKFEYQGKPYTYDSGEEYYKSISLEIDLILSEEQKMTGFNKDYLGMYEFSEQYISQQGYKVNLMESITEDDFVYPENFQTEKIAVFMAEGIRYELSGNVSMETMKEIVDSME